ncbi:hypothetical protein DERP_001620 [Dermatophagoides pteronyssinus]|uniref:Uncharacterized protein n=1 Tax=Dermatophagoides pteronyssinus TaxID=6956 RepID=A0ABQ8JB11_DERPT|nr:hypothetical protein DERP_001620 [Dermatophagoides pteronyssinus]
MYLKNYTFYHKNFLFEYFGFKTGFELSLKKENLKKIWRISAITSPMSIIGIRTIPHGYSRPRIRSPFTSIISTDDETANGIEFCNCLTLENTLYSISSSGSQSGIV